MKDHFDIAGEASLVAQRPSGPTDLLSVIAQAVADPRMDVDKMRALFELQRDIQAEQRKIVFVSAMTRLQGKIPPMSKDGQGKNSKYARLEDMNIIMKPLLHEFGFSVSFDEESHTEKTVTLAMKVSHEDGHAEIKRLTVAIDAAAKNSKGDSIRPAIQDSGSTVSYARRYLYKMHFDIVEKGEDTDGESRELIGEETIKDLETAIADVGLDRKRFLLYMRIGDLKEILKADLKTAWNAIDVKRQDNETKGKK